MFWMDFAPHIMETVTGAGIRGGRRIVLAKYKFEELRETYGTFEYRDFTVRRIEGGYRAAFHFAVPGLREFESVWEFPGEEGMDGEILQKLLFHLGMAETISYWKCACPKRLEVKCGSLSKEQRAWWRKLYHNGLGEFMYRNGITASEEELVEIVCEGDGEPALRDARAYEGCLVPVGGGKDSVVSLELLKGEGVTTYCVNGNGTTERVIQAYGSQKGDYVARRRLDPQLLELNGLGYLNGHIPFSAVVAFSSVVAAYLCGARHITLSNETSANETTVPGSFVNHQYSKSFEFEQDFAWYLKTVTDSDIHYFSLLRPLTEIQIAWLFSKCKKYHPVFRSCNAGSKQGIWCCNCPKCLFVYIILTPFLEREELNGIFGEDLLEKESLETYFRELTGIDENKPFECVGTRREALVALKAFVQKGGRSLLTDRYRDAIASAPGELEDLLGEWASENSVPEEYESLLRRWMGQ